VREHSSRGSFFALRQPLVPPPNQRQRRPIESSGSTAPRQLASGLAIICWINSCSRCRSWGVLVKNSIPIPSSGSMTRTFPSALTEQSATRAKAQPACEQENGDAFARSIPQNSDQAESSGLGIGLSPHCRRNHSFKAAVRDIRERRTDTGMAPRICQQSFRGLDHGRGVR